MLYPVLEYATIGVYNSGAYFSLNQNKNEQKKRTTIKMVRPPVKYKLKKY